MTTEWHTEAIDDDAKQVRAEADVLVKEGEDESPEALADGAPTDSEAETAKPARREATFTPAKAAALRVVLMTIRSSVDNALKLLDDGDPSGVQTTLLGLVTDADVLSKEDEKSEEGLASSEQTDDRLIEGVFDGQGMVGADGKGYAVPPNYASKSKLVEGDMLKLTIGARGNFIYKQTGPIERQRLIGTLAFDQETGQYLVLAGGRSWKVLKASITYYKADAGDEAVILVPKSAPSRWAAVENVIKKLQGTTMQG